MKHALASLFILTYKVLDTKDKATFGMASIIFALLIAFRLCTPVSLAMLTAAVINGDSTWLKWGVVYAGLFFLIRASEEVKIAVYTLFKQQMRRKLALSILDDFFKISFVNSQLKTSSEYAIQIDRGLGGLQTIVYSIMFSLLPFAIETIIGILIISLKISLIVGLSCLCIVTLFLIFTFLISVNIHKLTQIFYKTATRNFHIYSESIRFYEMLRSFHATKWAKARYSLANQQFINEVVASVRPLMPLGVIQGILLFCLMISASFMVLTLGPEGSDRVTGFVLVNGLLWQISTPLLYFSQSYRQLLNGMSSAAELTELINMRKYSSKISVSPCNDSALSYRFENFELTADNKTVVKCRKLEVPKARLLMIVGGSGAGKTTLARAMSGLLDCSGGVECWYSVDNIYYCSQVPDIFDVSLEDNVSLGEDISDEAMNSVLTAAGFTNIEIESLNNRSLGEYGAHISGGQKRRIGIARMLLRQGEVMIFDEPTAELDDLACHRVMSTLKNMSANQLVVVITHDVKWQKFCDAQLIIANHQLSLKTT